MGRDPMSAAKTVTMAFRWEGTEEVAATRKVSTTSNRSPT